MPKKLLVCMGCRVAIFLDSMANVAPRWSGNIGDNPETRKEIGGLDDLGLFNTRHRRHKKIEVRLAEDEDLFGVA